LARFGGALHAAIGIGRTPNSPVGIKVCRRATPARYLVASFNVHQFAMNLLQIVPVQE
jgi:hypothetical protein